MANKEATHCNAEKKQQTACSEIGMVQLKFLSKMFRNHARASGFWQVASGKRSKSTYTYNNTFVTVIIRNSNTRYRSSKTTWPASLTTIIVFQIQNLLQQ